MRPSSCRGAIWCSKVGPRSKPRARSQLCRTRAYPVPSRVCCPKLLVALGRFDVFATDARLMLPRPETGRRRPWPSGPRRSAHSQSARTDGALCSLFASATRTSSGGVRVNIPPSQVTRFAEGVGWQSQDRDGCRQSPRPRPDPLCLPKRRPQHHPRSDLVWPRPNCNRPCRRPRRMRLVWLVPPRTQPVSLPVQNAGGRTMTGHVSLVSARAPVAPTRSPSAARAACKPLARCLIIALPNLLCWITHRSLPIWHPV